MYKTLLTHFLEVLHILSTTYLFPHGRWAYKISKKTLLLLQEDLALYSVSYLLES